MQPTQHQTLDDQRSYPTTRSRGGHTQASASDRAPNTTGPHKYDILNKLDPTVDSGDGVQILGHGAKAARQPTTTAANQQPIHTNTMAPGAVHPSVEPAGNFRAENAVVPGPGPAPNTAGPHSTDMMNKLDPRVANNAKMAVNPSSGGNFSNIEPEPLQRTEEFVVPAPNESNRPTQDNWRRN